MALAPVVSPTVVRRTRRRQRSTDIPERRAPALHGLQRAVGNQAVASLLRQVAAPPSPLAPPGPPPIIFDPNACPSEEEQKKKDKFKARTDLKLTNHIPSPGLGKFDASYQPKTGKMPVTVKLHFAFTDHSTAPKGWDLLLRRLRGEDLSSTIWDQTQKDDYVSQFTKRVHDRWSGQFTMRSVKPCWDFTALPDINVVTVKNKADAHFAVTVHKSPGPIEYKSAVNNEHLLNPATQPTADFYQSDNRENPDFNSKVVATTERQRLEAAIAASGAGRLLFTINSDKLSFGATVALPKLITALKAAFPSAPLIPILIDGFASSDGDPTWNSNLAQKRADAVAKALTDAGIRQPVTATGKGPVGAKGDGNNRAAAVACDRTFETTYASNRYSVSEHEFGHFLGNPDEYSNAAPATPLGGVQTKYSGLITSAGLSVPTFGQLTSSQMSAGVDVLPEHYVTLWEALGKMTAPDLGQADWSLRR